MRNSEKQPSFSERDCLSGQIGTPLIGEAQFCSHSSGHAQDWILTKMSAQAFSVTPAEVAVHSTVRAVGEILSKVMRREIKNKKRKKEVKLAKLSSQPMLQPPDYIKC